MNKRRELATHDDQLATIEITKKIIHRLNTTHWVHGDYTFRQLMISFVQLNLKFNFNYSSVITKDLFHETV
jgi:hypothetical protein